MLDTVLARWESARGKYWVIAIQSPDGTFGFKANGAAGYGYSSAKAAMARAELEATFQPSTMRRVL